MADKTVAQLLGEVRTKRAELNAELAKLDAVESFLAASSQNGEALPKMPRADASPRGKRSGKLQHLMKWEAIEVVLREAGKPLKIGEIIDRLAAEGYGTHLKRSVQHNSIYTTMNRKGELFVKNDKAEWTVVANKERRTD